MTLCGVGMGVPFCALLLCILVYIYLIPRAYCFVKLLFYFILLLFVFIFSYSYLFFAVYSFLHFNVFVWDFCLILKEFPLVLLSGVGLMLMISFVFCFSEKFLCRFSLGTEFYTDIAFSSGLHNFC